MLLERKYIININSTSVHIHKRLGNEIEFSEPMLEERDLLNDRQEILDLEEI